MRRTTLSLLCLCLAAAACTSTMPTTPWLDPSTAKLTKGGGGKVSKDKTEWTSFAIPAGKDKTYVFDLETDVPLVDLDYAMKDEAGAIIPADSASDVVHRVAVLSHDGLWRGNAEVNPGWQSGSVPTDVIPAGKFHVYVEASSDRFSIMFRLRFKKA